MQQIGFGMRWISLIMQCVRTVRYTVVHGLREIGPINSCNGLRQRDPISSYLFIICLQEFSALIRQYENIGWIKECKVARHVSVVTHMLVADDCYLNFSANIKEANHAVQLLQVFGKTSGKQIYFDKSSALFSTNTIIQQVKEQVRYALYIHEAENDTLDLGLPNILGRNKKKR